MHENANENELIKLFLWMWIWNRDRDKKEHQHTEIQIKWPKKCFTLKWFLEFFSLLKSIGIGALDKLVRVLWMLAVALHFAFNVLFTRKENSQNNNTINININRNKKNGCFQIPSIHTEPYTQISLANACTHVVIFYIVSHVALSSRLYTLVSC